MPLTKSSSLECVISNNIRSKTSVLILHNDLLNVDNGRTGTVDIIKLRHPRSGCGAMFLFSHDNSVIQELFSLSEKRSWFINDCVRENGKIYFSTPIDPLFLLLPYLKKSKEERKVIPLEDLLIDDVFPETTRILKSFAINNIHLIADKKGYGDLNAWMYNEGKTMKWLCRKTEKVAEVLMEKQTNIGGTATSKNFFKSVKEDPSSFDKTTYLKHAYGLVSEYLTDDLNSKLLSSLGLSELEPSEKKCTNKRKSSESEESFQIMKKLKTEDETVEILKLKKSKSLSGKEKAMMKAASGSKSITSFFRKN